MQSEPEVTLEERYAVKFCFKLGKNATKTNGIIQTAFGVSCMNRASVFECLKRFKEGRESVRDDERCGRSKEVNRQELIGQMVRVMVKVLRKFRIRFRRKKPAHFKLGQLHFHWDNAPVHNSIVVTDYLIKMRIKFLSLPIVQTMLPVTFGCSLNSEAVVMRQLRRWKRLWRRSLTCSHKMISMGPSRSLWDGNISVLVTIIST